MLTALNARSQKDRPAFQVVSAFPGRIRVQFASHPRLDGTLQAFARSLETTEGVHQTRIAVDARSVIVQYDRLEYELAVMVHQAETVAVGLTRSDTSLPARVPARTRNGMAPGLELAQPRADKARESPLVAVMHSLPGRLRVRIPWLRTRQHIAAHLETRLRDNRGIHHVEARHDSGTMIVHYDPGTRVPGTIVRLVSRLLRLVSQSPPGHQEITRARDIPEQQQAGLHPLLMPSVAVALAITGLVPAAIVGGAIAVAALPIAGRAVAGLRQRRPNVDQLDLAALVILTALGDFISGSLMTGLIGLGDMIRGMTMRRSRRAISELMSPENQQAWVEREGAVVSVSVARLEAGDTVLVFPGDTVPVDGVVSQGRALVDMKVLTGESVPVPKEVGDPVFALTTVADGQMAVRVEHIGNETRAGRVAALIEEAPLSDTRVQNYAAMLGDRLVLPIFGLAGVTYLLTGDLLRLAAILILDFATGIRVSAPTTVLSAMMGAAKQGLFIKGGKALERLAQVNAVVLDKTGTLTRGKPFVRAVHVADSGLSANEVLRLAACAEANLKHPAAQAVVEAAQERGLAIKMPTQMEYALGLGVQAMVEAQTLRVGSERFMRQSGIDTTALEREAAEHSREGNSLIYIAAEDRLIGLLAYSDPPRPESALVLQALRARGLERIVMLTGDNALAARSVARELGITDVIADAFPERKVEVVQGLRAQGYTVAVIGDGVNDAPAFAHADVSISLAHGADVAKETADIILLDGDLWGLPRAIDLAKGSMGILHQNLQIVLAPTAVGMVGSVAGMINPLVSTLINNGTTVVAGLNALRPMRFQAHSDVPESRPLLPP